MPIPTRLEMSMCAAPLIRRPEETPFLIPCQYGRSNLTVQSTIRIPGLQKSEACPEDSIGRWSGGHYCTGSLGDSAFVPIRCAAEQSACTDNMNKGPL